MQHVGQSRRIWYEHLALVGTCTSDRRQILAWAAKLRPLEVGAAQLVVRPKAQASNQGSGASRVGTSTGRYVRIWMSSWTRGRQPCAEGCSPATRSMRSTMVRVFGRLGCIAV